MRFTEVIQPANNDDPVALSALMTQDIEEQIRRAPEQWVWMHDRWRDRPKWDIGGGPRSSAAAEDGGAPPTAGRNSSR